jgi:hypothetical protein
VYGDNLDALLDQRSVRLHRMQRSAVAPDGEISVLMRISQLGNGNVARAQLYLVPSGFLSVDSTQRSICSFQATAIRKFRDMAGNVDRCRDLPGGHYKH